MTHGSVLGQSSHTPASVKVRCHFITDSEKDQGPWEIMATSLSSLPLPSTGKCPFQGALLGC